MKFKNQQAHAQVLQMEETNQQVTESDQAERQLEAAMVNLMEEPFVQLEWSPATQQADPQAAPVHLPHDHSEHLPLHRLGGRAPNLPFGEGAKRARHHPPDGRLRQVAPQHQQVEDTPGQAEFQLDEHVDADFELDMQQLGEGHGWQAFRTGTSFTRGFSPG